MNVILNQPYLPKYKNPRTRHFVVVNEDKWTQNTARRFLNKNSSAIDSTFLTNQYDILLYVAIVLNQDRKMVVICYMLCIKDV